MSISVNFIVSNTSNALNALMMGKSAILAVV